MQVCNKKRVEFASYHSVILGVAVQATQHVFIFGQREAACDFAAQPVFIFGQREALPGIKFRPTEASGPVRRPNIREESPGHGPCCGVESIKALF